MSSTNTMTKDTALVFVEVVDMETNKVVKQLGPMSDSKAQKVQSGILINMNSEKYFVQIVSKSKTTVSTGWL